MPGFSYRTATTSLKLAVTGWLLLAVVGLGVAGLQIDSQAGLTPTRALQHYQGDEATLQYPMNFAVLVGITHAHAFTLPMLALVLSLGLVASSAREWLKRIVVTALFSGMVLELAMPWVVRYGPAWTVHLFPLIGVLIIGGLFPAVVLPLYEMWWTPEHVGTAARPQAWQPGRWPFSLGSRIRSRNQ
jgi:hypothetical protein